MRRSRIAVFLSIVVLVVLAVPATLAAPADEGPVVVRLVADDGDRIVLDIDLVDFDRETVTIDGREYVRFVVPGEGMLLEKGSPELPLIARSVIVPDDRKMAVRLLESTWTEVEAVPVPSKGSLPRTVDPATVPWEFGPAYRGRRPWPATPVAAGRPYILRDVRGLAVRVTPFVFDPVRGITRIYTHVRVELRDVGPGEINVIDRAALGWKPSRAFRELMRAHFVNFEERDPAAATPEEDGDRYPDMDEDGSMLIICHDPWVDRMTAFADHKSAMGIPADVVPVGDVGNDPDSIKEYIRQRYDSTNLAFVLLVGDIDQVASPTVNYSGREGPGDPTYALLAGDDDYPDIMIGRFSAQRDWEVDTQTERTIDYEGSLDAIHQDWFMRATGIASDQGAGQGDEGQMDKEHMDEIRDWLLDAGYDPVDQIYDPGATDTQVADALNAGRGLVNYCGHGSETSWGTTGFNVDDVDALVNDDMLPFIFSVACVNGAFHKRDKCFAEAWLRATDDSTGRPTGAITFYGSSINQDWAPPMEAQDEFNLLLTDPDHPYHTVGALYFAGSCSMIEKYPSEGPGMYKTWHIFGDPSLRVYGDASPHGMEVTPPEGVEGSGPAGGPFDPDRRVYTVKNRDQEETIDFQVTADDPWVVAEPSAGTLGPGESAEVTVSFGELAHQLDNGDHQATIRFVNLTDHAGDTTRPARLHVGRPVEEYSWNLDTDPGWSRDGEWEFGQPQGGGGSSSCPNPDPSSGATGTNVFGINLSGNYDRMAGDPQYLVLGPVDLSAATGTRIRYMRWLNAGQAPVVSQAVEVSTDGSTWEKVWEAEGPTSDDHWVEAEHEAPRADHHASVWFRFKHHVQLTVVDSCSGWNVDDVEILASPATARVRVTVEKDAISWDRDCGAEAFDVVRGDLRELHESGGDFAAATKECLADDLDADRLDWTAAPPAGEGWWVLVRGVADGDPMTWESLADSQVGLRDDEIDASPNTCP